MVDDVRDGDEGGAGSALVAMGEEPRVAATWEDSSYASMGVGIDDGLAERGLPGFLDIGAVEAGQLLQGVNVDSLTPLKAMAKLDGRPIAIVHGTADQTVPIRHADLLIAAAHADGSTVDPWILQGVAHVRASFVATAEYESRLIAFFTSAIGGQ